jgi:cytochrome c peroxidase
MVMQSRKTKNRNTDAALLTLLATLFTAAVVVAAEGPSTLPNMAAFPNAAGVLRVFSTTGNIELTGPFFQNLGSNGRSCASCHQPGDAMSLSAEHAQDRFNKTQGLDPLFRTNDGANCDHNIDTSTEAGRSAAYSLLRTRGLLRVALTVPAGADFTIESVSNPYGCGDTSNLSLYRRPLPAANLKFLSTLMWDGRESSAQTGTTPIQSANYPQSLNDDLKHQSVDATAGHAQGTLALTAEQQDAIVSFENSLFTAQAESHSAGNLTAKGATGGPANLAAQSFFIGINDPVGLNPMGTPFTGAVFNLFDSWTSEGNPHRASIARGQALFNSRTFAISGVGGLNNATFGSTTLPGSFVGSCGTCHDSLNAGDHSVAAPLDIGVATSNDPSINLLNLSYLPTFIVKKTATGEIVTTTDPGRALITGKFADVARFKGPVLRGLAARAPYFHNGSAQTLLDVVNFYDRRFAIGLSAQDKADLVAFLQAL